MHSELCPICKGDGNIDIIIGDEKKVKIFDCHGCDGKGWISVEDDKITYVPIYVYPQPIYIQPVPYYPVSNPNFPTMPIITYSTSKGTGTTNDTSGK